MTLAVALPRDRYSAATMQGLELYGIVATKITSGLERLNNTSDSYLESYYTISEA